MLLSSITSSKRPNYALKYFCGNPSYDFIDMYIIPLALSRSTWVAPTSTNVELQTILLPLEYLSSDDV